MIYSAISFISCIDMICITLYLCYNEVNNLYCNDVYHQYGNEVNDLLSSALYKYAIICNVMRFIICTGMWFIICIVMRFIIFTPMRFMTCKLAQV